MVAFKKYFVKNKKKNISILLALLLCITSVTVWITANRTNASVIVKDKDGNKVIHNEIKILEIVARDGQQVLGYTVEGQEPISVSDIENYEGDMDLDVDDFEAATGYKVTKSQTAAGKFKYHVESNSLNTTLNQNVFAQQMNRGEILVKAVPASELKVSDITTWQPDLVYINSSDYNDNLEYYYDQFKHNGTSGIKMGDKPVSYNDVYMNYAKRYDTSVLEIANAVGFADKASELTPEDFEFVMLSHIGHAEDDIINFDNYKDYNFSAYVKAISEAAEGSISTTISEAVPQINALMGEVNTTCEANAIQTIIDYTQAHIGNEEYTNEEKSNVLSALQAAEVSGYNALNADDYFAEINSYPAYGFAITKGDILGNAGTPSLVATVNADQATKAINQLVAYKTTVVETRAAAALNSGAAPDPESDKDENGLTIEDYINMYTCLEKADVGTINSEFVNDYFAAFLDDDFTFTGDVESVEALRNAVAGINNTHREDALTRFAALPGADSALVDEFAKTARADFRLMGLTEYNAYYVDYYIEEVRKLTDPNAFKTGDNYDTAKMDAFFKNVNDTTDVIEKSFVVCDIPWKVALTLYEEASADRLALMYNIDMLTNGTICDYTADLSDLAAKQTSEYIAENEIKEVDNTNNLYKMLLLLRQIRDTYYTTYLQDKIDEFGYYYAGGIDSGDAPVTSWNKDTFGTDFDNYEKYREPDVIGTTYDTDGTIGISDGCYVYKRIYSYSGTQFFGGNLFVNGMDGDSPDVHFVLGSGKYSDTSSSGGIVTDKSLLEDNKYILLHTYYASDSVIKNNSPLYTHLWNNSDQSAPQTFYPVTREMDGNYWHRVHLIDGYNNFLVTGAAAWNTGHQTNDYKNSKSVSELVGKMFIVSGYSIYDYSANWPYAIGGITNSINNGTVEYEGSVEGLKFWMYASDVDNVKASYRLQVNGQYLYCDNPEYYHYTENNTTGGNYQPFSFDDEIKIYRDKILVGDDEINQFADGSALNIPQNAVVTITLVYTLENFGTVTRTYSYKNVASEDYKINVSNFVKDGNVEFCGYADMLFDYSGMEYVRYTFDGNTVDVGSGNVISLGQTMSEGEAKQMTLTYKPVGKSEITVKTTLRKVTAEMPKNYLSGFTASNSSSLAENPLLAAGDNASLVGATKGEVLRYLMNVSLADVNYPIRVLEIQPAASISELSAFNGARIIADWYNIDLAAEGITTSNYTDYIQVDSMSVREFNTRNLDLTADYDLVYFGIKSGYQVVNKYTVNGQTLFRTFYNDQSLNGTVYNGIGDLYGLYPVMKGTAASDYKMSYNLDVTSADEKQKYEEWKKFFADGLMNNDIPSWNLYNVQNTGVASRNYYLISNTNSYTRLNGSDLTVLRMEDLLNYLKAGYPVVMADEIIDCVIYQDGKIVDNPAYVPYIGHTDAKYAASWRYVDVYSKMYNFVKQAKELGLDGSGNYTVKSDFKDGKTYAGLISVSNAKSGGNPEYMSAEDKFKGGLSFANRRIAKVDFEYVSGPQEYTKDTNGNDIVVGNLGTTIGRDDPGHKTFDILLNVKRNNGIDEREIADKFNYIMYVDKSGIGKFEPIDTVDIDCEHEFIKNEDGKVTQVRVTGNWPGEIEGFIPWKLELTQKDNPDWKFTYNAFSAFARENTDKKDVYVVWIYPSKNLTLNFKTVLNNNKSTLNQTEFNIHLIALDYNQFTATWSGLSDELVFDDSNSKLKVATMYNRMTATNKNNSWNLKGNEASLTDTDIDMIVVGFSDSFDEMDIKNVAALNNIQYFLDAGHSLLYSHDNSSYLPSLNWYIDGKGNHGSGSNYAWGRYTTVFFRQMLGMDTYGISYGSDSETPQAYLNARMYLNPDKVKQESFRGVTENCIFHYSPNVNFEGFAITGKDRLYSNNYNSNSPNNYGDWCHTNRVMKTNRGQITEYPYILGEFIPTAVTHTQYFTVTLEDPELTIWYTLDEYDGSRSHGNNSQMYKFTKGDGANNYYIYSRGNITYTGSGHASGQTAEEQKLFINTVIAAIKIPNFKPVVTLKSGYKKNGENYVDYLEGSSGVNITFNPADNDMRVGDSAFTDCKIFVDLDGDGVYTEGSDILINDPADVQVSNVGGVPENVVGTELANREDKTFRLTLDNINAIDTKVQAKDASKTIYDYKIVIAVSDKGYLKAMNPVPAVGSISFKLEKKTEPTYDLFTLK